jgi:DNA-binding response OmpR family regulator
MYKNINPKTILVVEDNDRLRDNIISALEFYFNVTFAQNGAEGIKLAKSIKPDLIITDIIMPEVNGYELLHLIKKDDNLKNVPVIMLTALGADDDIIKGWDIGADEYVVKPFKMNILISRIQNLIKKNAITSGTQPLLLKREDPFIEQINLHINNHIDDINYAVNHLADSLNLTSTQLNRRLKKIVGQNTILYIKNFRLDFANQLLKFKSYNISEVARLSGFSSSSYFIKQYKQKFGKSPKQNRNQYANQIEMSQVLHD